MKVHSEDLSQAKSVLTVLGFMTRSSIATLKTTKKIDGLEHEYIKMRSIKQDDMDQRFPDLKMIDSFTPGMKSVILEIVSHLNQKQKVFDEDHDQKMKEHLLEKAKKVGILLINTVCFDLNLLHFDFEDMQQLERG